MPNTPKITMGWAQTPALNQEWHYFINNVTLCMRTARVGVLIDQPMPGSAPCFTCAFVLNKVQRQLRQTEMAKTLGEPQ